MLAAAEAQLALLEQSVFGQETVTAPLQKRVEALEAYVEALSPATPLRASTPTQALTDEAGGTEAPYAERIARLHAVFLKVRLLG